MVCVMLHLVIVYVYTLTCTVKLSCRQGRQSGRVGFATPPPPPPLIFERGLNSPAFERIIFLLDHICYYVQVISIGGGGGVVGFP